MKKSKHKRIKKPWISLKMLCKLGFLLGLCVLLLFLTAKSWSFKLKPGSLSGAHSAIHSCKTCHDHIDQKPTQTLFNFFTNRLTDHNKQCVACHSFDSVLESPHHQKKSECTTCHREHQKFEKLLSIGDQQCHICHEKKFTNFSTNHPPFEGYPFAERGAIIFDHQKHFNDYFKKEKYKKKAPEKCLTCHQLVQQGDGMQLKSYEKTCAVCHDKEILGDQRVDQKGVTVFNIPGIDLETLEKHHHFIDGWPKEAEEELLPFTQVILANQKKFQFLYKKINTLDLTDLKTADPKQLQAVVQLTKVIKERLQMLSKRGQSSLFTPQPKMPPESLPKDSVAMLLQQSGILSNGDANAPALNAFFQSDLEPEDWMQLGGWYYNDYKLMYRPRYHADKFMRYWLDFTGEHLGEAPYYQALFNELSDPEAPGACGKCHSLRRESKKQMSVEWKTKVNKASLKHRQLTRFSHAPHMSLMSDKGCKTCHALTEKGDYLANFSQDPPEKFVSNFQAIEVAVCSKCHNNEQVNQSCISCHYYHDRK